MTADGTTGRNLVACGAFALVACLCSSGCSDATIVSSRVVPPGSTVRSDQARPEDEPRVSESAGTVETGDTPAVVVGAETTAAAEKPIVVPVEGTATVDASAKPAATPVNAVATSVEERAFRSEGPDGAVRVTFDDLDLLKVLKMDPVTPDCVQKMPPWLKGLNGKKVRIRGFMKPGLVMTGIPQFMLVRDTGLCCFGPKGKIYDMIATTLKPPATTDYIELRPFDVVGTFRIELLEEDVIIFGLYYLDDAQIIQR